MSSPAEQRTPPGAATAFTGSLSPSRAADFMACPLRYRFRVLDKLPEPPSPAATRGTVVHAVLERLYDLPRADRTPERADDLVQPEWERLLGAEPELSTLFADEQLSLADFLRGAKSLVADYFTLEDPTRLEPAARELYVETVLESGLRLRGYVDRLDVTPSGELRVVDYKTGRSPGESFESRALFQLRFYALVLWRLHGRVPRLLQLLYLGNQEILRYSPDEAELLATERMLGALWEAIDRAMSTGDWRAHRGRQCDWCSHQCRCPEWGGTPPPLPVDYLAVPEPVDELPSTHAAPDEL